jgi:predicted DNA repair protein MutK
MAGTSLLALIDDIATILDDVAVLTKLSARKTAGVLGDDLALNAEQVTGVKADRELPVVWAVAKGSALNKCILVPAALAISATVPALITPLLMLGGAFLCFEGFEKVAELFTSSKEEKEAEHLKHVEANRSEDVDLVAFEKNKVKGAIRTDFVLSAEIIVIALGTVQGQPLATQVGVLVSIAVLMTVGVYGLVALIVRLDDIGLALAATEGEGGSAAIKRACGNGLLAFAPFLMKTLSVVGTAAMFLVGGGILVHGVPFIANFINSIEMSIGGFMGAMAATLSNGVVGLIAGGLVVAVVHAGMGLVRRPPAP